MKVNSAINKKAKRPFIILALCLIFLVPIILGWIRVQQAIQNWNLAQSLVGSFLTGYTLVSGVLWGLIAIPAVVGLWLHTPWARWVAWVAAIFYLFTYWLEKIFLVKSPTQWTNWPFDAGITILLLFFVSLALYLPASQKYLEGEQ